MKQMQNEDLTWKHETHRQQVTQTIHDRETWQTLKGSNAWV